MPDLIFFFFFFILERSAFINMWTCTASFISAFFAGTLIFSPFFLIRRLSFNHDNFLCPIFQQLFLLLFNMWIESLTTLPMLVLLGLYVWTNVRILLLFFDFDFEFKRSFLTILRAFSILVCLTAAVG